MSGGVTSKRDLKFTSLIFGVVLLLMAVFVIAATVDSVTLVSPANNSWTNSTNDSIAFIFNYTGSNATDASCELFVGGVGFGLNANTVNATDTTLYANDTIDEGFYNWSVTCTNESSPSSSNFTLNVDRTNPSVSLLYPTAVNYRSLSQLNFSATDDSSLSICWYSINSSVNVTTPGCANVTGLTPETQGSNTWTVYANDSAGNENLSSVVFNYDSANPNVVAFNTPGNNANLSSTQVINVTVNDTTLTVATVFFNVSNGTQQVWSEASLSSGDYWNATLNTSALADGDYNITVYANDTVGNFNSSEYITVTVDNTAPTASFGTNPINVKNASSGTVVFDLKCSDGYGVGTMQLWGNWSGAWAVNSTNSSISNNTFSNITLSLSDGTYLWGVYCNDSEGNSDWTGTNRTLIVDTTNPTASASCTATDVRAGDSITCTCAASDVTSGVSSSTASTTVDTSSLSGSQTYTCSVTDYSGNSASSIATYSVSSGGGSSGGSGGSSKVYTPSETKILNGYDISLGKYYEVKFKISDQDHVLKVDNVSSSSVTITVSSDPITLEVNLGETEKLDVDSDGYYDLSIYLKEIKLSMANLVITSINEKISEGEGPVTTIDEEGAVQGEESDAGDVQISEKAGGEWIYYVVGIVLLIVLVVIFVKKSKKD